MALFRRNRNKSNDGGFLNPKDAPIETLNKLLKIFRDEGHTDPNFLATCVSSASLTKIWKSKMSGKITVDKNEEGIFVVYGEARLKIT